MKLPPLLMRPEPLVLVVDDDRLQRSMARDAAAPGNRVTSSDRNRCFVIGGRC